MDAVIAPRCGMEGGYTAAPPWVSTLMDFNPVMAMTVIVSPHAEALPKCDAGTAGNATLFLSLPPPKLPFLLA